MPALPACRAGWAARPPAELPLLLPRAALRRRGQRVEGRRVLKMLRGTEEVDAELADICDAAHQAAGVSALQARAAQLGSRCEGRARLPRAALC